MKLRLRLFTPTLDGVTTTDAELVRQPDVVTFDGRRYLRESDGDTERDGALAFDYVEEATYAIDVISAPSSARG